MWLQDYRFGKAKVWQKKMDFLLEASNSKGSRPEIIKLKNQIKVATVFIITDMCPICNNCNNSKRLSRCLRGIFKCIKRKKNGCNAQFTVKIEWVCLNECFHVLNNFVSLLTLIPGSCLLKIHYGVSIKGLLDFSTSRIPADYFHCGSTLLCVTTQEPKSRETRVTLLHSDFLKIEISHMNGR